MSNPGPTVGSIAPEFALPCTRGSGAPRETATLSGYRGRWLALTFYPRDFSLVCPTELTALSSRFDEFQQAGCEILGISTDPIETHEKWLATPRGHGGLGGLRFPLASDVDGAACKAYGVYVPYQHLAVRGLFIIDPNNVLQYQAVHNLSVGRRSDEVLRVLSALQTGGLCPEDWSRDDATLDPTQALRPGSVVSQYRVEEELGGGTFARVFRARDLVLQRTVALKVMKPNGTKTAGLLLAEARAAAALNHPNVCTVFAVDHSDGVSLIAMEYLAGEPLNKVLEAGPLPRGRAAHVSRQIAQGLAAAHAQGIAHGDLKPANVMLGASDLVKIMDFGLARIDQRLPHPEETITWEPEPEERGAISGTPSYMSPEQARGERITPASDVFSFGLLLYEMLTGRRAICGKSIFQVLDRITAINAERYAADVREPFATILRKALHPQPTMRGLSMEEIAEMLAN